MRQPPEIIRDFLSDEDFPKFALGAMSYPHYSPCAFTASQEEDDGSMWTFGENLKSVDGTKLEETMFQAVLFNRNQFLRTDFYELNYYFIKKFTKMLNVKKWWIIRINATMGHTKPYVGAFHNDFCITDSSGNLLKETSKMPDIYKKCKTAIYYLNTNNGGTQFEDGPFVQSKANTLVRFPTSYSHAGVWCTNAKLRFAVNMNYEENE